MIAVMFTALFDAIAELAAPPRDLPAGHVLFQRDDPVRHLCLVVRGEAQLRRDRAGGDTLVLQRAGAGAILAEASVWSARHHCDGVLVTEATIRRLSVARMRAALADPELMRAYAAHLAGELQATRGRAEWLRLPRLSDRLDAYVALRGALPPKGAWRTLAAELGVTPEALYRALARRRSGVGSDCGPAALRR